MKIVSKAQAKFLGGIAGGSFKKKGGPTAAKAKKMLGENRGFKMRNLPKRAPKRSRSRAPKR